MGSQSFDRQRPTDSIRVEWETSHVATGAAAKRKQRSYPTAFWFGLSAEQREGALRVYTKHHRQFDTIEEAIAFSAAQEGSAFIQVRYVGNKNHTFVGRDGGLF